MTAYDPVLAHALHLYVYARDTARAEPDEAEALVRSTLVLEGIASEPHASEYAAAARIATDAIDGTAVSE